MSSRRRKRKFSPGSLRQPSSPPSTPHKYCTHSRRNLRKRNVGGRRAAKIRRKANKKKRMQRRNIRLLPLGVEVGRRFAFYGDVLCKRMREEVEDRGQVGEERASFGNLRGFRGYNGISIHHFT